MVECSDGKLGVRLGCILSYDGELRDIVINYALVALNLVWCIIALGFHTRDIDKKAKLRSFAIASLLFGKRE